MLVGTHGCRPWRFGARDYATALARLAPMVGELPRSGSAPTRAVLGRRADRGDGAGAGRAVHEELVLDDLLADMTGGPAAGVDDALDQPD